jgi:hypothetical protein
MPTLSKKSTTQIGSQIQCLYQKRIKIGGCVLIMLISTRHAKKYPFDLPQIDQIMDSMVGCSLLSFLD